MPKRTIKEVCEIHGITLDVFKSARTNGVNVWNDAEMATHLGSRRHRIKPGTEIPEDSPAANAYTLEEIEEEIRTTRCVDTLKILKAKMDSLKIVVQVRAELRELVPAGEVRQSITKVVSAARAEMLKLAAELPPKLDGLDAAAMNQVIRNEVIEVLTRLSDETNSLYQ